MESSGTIQSVEKALKILEYLEEEQSAARSTIADYLDLSESTTHYYLSTLQSHNILYKEEGEYHLGYKLLEYGGVVKSRNELYNYAKPHMDRIAIETDLAVYLGIKDQKEVVHIASISIEGTSIIGDHDGKRTKFHSAALGKAILAYLPDSERQAILSEIEYPEFTDKTITDRENLESSLEVVREEGYAINDEEDFRGWKGIAVPVLSDKRVEGSISVAGPKSKIDNRQEAIIQLLQESRDEIELQFTVS
jgi:DNA-binding IclR family transcriptional regulator